MTLKRRCILIEKRQRFEHIHNYKQKTIILTFFCSICAICLFQLQIQLQIAIKVNNEKLKH